MRYFHQRLNKRRFKYVGITCGSLFGLYSLDFYLDKAFQRNLRCLAYGVLVSLDYKLNFNIQNAQSIDKLHKRTAERISYVCRKNGGLYIKFGQQIASMNHVLPPEYQAIFSQFFDDAPSSDYGRVRQILYEEFGRNPDDIFDEFSEKPVASASIAQVHTAKLKDGTKVAVKVQKPEIAKQMYWDLAMYRFVTFCFENIFDLPLSWSVDYIQEHFEEEIDFINEGKNSEKAFKGFQDVKILRENCHVPKIYWDQSTKKILTMEWIDGIKFRRTHILEKGYSPSLIMKIVVEVFSNQIFRTGFCHCDPHPGNIIIREHPTKSNAPQIVLIDHGLYVDASSDFRHDYAIFWKSLFTQDLATLERIVKAWGMNDVQMFATMTLQKPWKAGDVVHIEGNRTKIWDSLLKRDAYEMQVKAKKRIQKFLTNSTLIPMELIFIGRNLNIVRSLNKEMGSPVNRVNMMAHSAVKSLGDDWSVWSNSTKSRTPLSIFQKVNYFWKSRLNYWNFQAILWLSSFAFYSNMALQGVQYFLFRKSGEGFEKLLEDKMKDHAGKYGLELNFDA